MQTYVEPRMKELERNQIEKWRLQSIHLSIASNKSSSSLILCWVFFIDEFLKKSRQFRAKISVGVLLILRVLSMVLKTGLGRELEGGVVPVLVVWPGSDRWSNRWRHK